MSVEFTKSQIAELDIELVLTASNLEYRNRSALVAKLPIGISEKLKGYAPFYCRDLKSLSLPYRALVVVADSHSDVAGREINVRIVNVEKWVNGYVYEYRANLESADLVALRNELGFVENSGTVNTSEFDGHILIGAGVINNSKLSKLLQSKIVLTFIAAFFVSVIFSNLYFVSMISNGINGGGLFVASEVFAGAFILLVSAALFFSIVKSLPVKGLVILSLFAALFFIDRIILALGLLL